MKPHRFLLLCLCLLSSLPLAALEFTAAERMLIAQHGPWPPQPEADNSNAVSENQAAISLGEMLFYDHGLGVDSKLSCASCHDPGQGFADGRIVGQGRSRLLRNTPSLLNLKGNRWFGWAGQNDSLWAQSIRPILAADEMASKPQQLRDLLRGREAYRRYYRQAFGVRIEDDSVEQNLVNTGKALAAYQETLFSPRSAFDDFRDALLNDDAEAMAKYPPAAQRGLKIFIGAGRCNLCHFGARFSNGEFSDVGIGYFTPDGVDAGRYRGIQQLRANPYNRLGPYNDGVAEQNAITTAQVRLRPGNWGEFKVPSLRGVAATAPYMHNGSLSSLHEVLLHYSKIDEARLHSDGEAVLRPLHLSAAQIDDLVSFLESLGN